MTADWRAMSPEEAALIRTIVAAAGGKALVLLERLTDARVRPATTWILDIESASPFEADLPTGPLPVRAYVPDETGEDGEVIVWISGGRISGLEYAWVTDRQPMRWPVPDEIYCLREDLIDARPDSARPSTAKSGVFVRRTLRGGYAAGEWMKSVGTKVGTVLCGA